MMLLKIDMIFFPHSILSYIPVTLVNSFVSLTHMQLCEILFHTGSFCLQIFKNPPEKVT